MTNKSVASDNTEVWVTINEACEHFRVSRSAFYRWLAQSNSELAKIVGRLPGSGRIRVPLKATERLLRSKPPRRPRTAPGDAGASAAFAALAEE